MTKSKKIERLEERVRRLENGIFSAGYWLCRAQELMKEPRVSKQEFLRCLQEATEGILEDEELKKAVNRYADKRIMREGLFQEYYRKHRWKLKKKKGWVSWKR